MEHEFTPIREHIDRALDQVTENLMLLLGGGNANGGPQGHVGMVELATHAQSGRPDAESTGA